MVKELKSKGNENNELADIVMPTIKPFKGLEKYCFLREILMIPLVT